MEYRTVDALCGIYKITNNINGKVYIGQSINIKARWQDHINSLNRDASHSVLLQRAWNKYGQDNFSFDIIELCSEDDLDDIEIQYIKLYNSIHNGYNIESGGNRNKCLSEETKEKIRNAHLGKSISEESRLKMSKSRTGKNNGMYGKCHSEESKNKMKEAKKGKSGRPCTDNQREQLRSVNLGKKLSEDTKRKIGEANQGKIPHNKSLRPVYCVELQKIFENPTSAGRELKIRSSNIIACCEHTRKTCGGYQWIYADTIEYIELTKLLTIQN